jgi:SSS family transporter
MRALTAVVLLAALMVPAIAAAQTPTAEQTATPIPAVTFDWSTLPHLPRPISGQTVGDSHGTLVVAGGTNFPTPPAEGGAKVWYDEIRVLEPGAAAWREAALLAHPLAYAASGSYHDRVIIAGGSDSTRHSAAALSLEWLNGAITVTPLPPIPAPVALAGGAVVGSTFYVAGGLSDPNGTSALRSVRALNLADAGGGWRELPPLPGAGRILPVVVAQSGKLFVMSGASLAAGADGKAVRHYLTDAWEWTPAPALGKGATADPASGTWRRIADVPRPVVAAPAAAVGQSHVVVFGGDDGVLADRAAELGDRHPGFSRDILAYHTITNTWTSLGTLPAGLVTTMAVSHDGAVTIAGGEDRPGHRSTEVLAGRLGPARRTFGALDYTVLAAYFIPLLLIGRYFSRSNRSTEDFFLGGRNVPSWAAGLSIYGTQLSAITFLAIPAKAYAENWEFFVANLCILIVAPLVVFFYLPFFRGLALTSVYEYLERRFNVAVRLFGSLSFIVLQLARMAIVLFLPALTLAAVTGIDVYVSILLMGVLCTAYTLDGGLNAVVWTDVMQVVVLLGAALVSLLVIVSRIDGGFAGVVSTAMADHKLRAFNWTWSAATSSVWVVVIGNVLANLVPYTADQAVVQRYLATRDESQAARAVWIGAWLTLPTSILFFGVGTALYVFYRTYPAALSPAVPTDAIFSWFIAQQLPAGISGLAVAGVFAAAMSTLSGSINSIVTAISADVQGRFRPGASDAHRLRRARWMSLVIGAIGTGSALLLGAANVGALWDAFLSSIGLFGGGLAGVFALGIFTRRASSGGALVGLVASAVVLFCVQRYTSLHFFLYAGTGIVTCVVAGYLASFMMPRANRSLDGLTIHTLRTSARRPALAVTED